MKSIEQTRVLVVDDDFLVVEFIKNHLESIGYQVVGVAKNGRLALERTEDLEPDVILMDIQMPEMDGIEATRAIMQERPTPVVFLTAFNGRQLLNRATEVGAGAYVVKPPKAPDLERAITIAMARFDDLMTIRRQNEKLQEALDHIKTLEGILPVCASCKKIRNEQGKWQELATYIHLHTKADVSHGLCPDCAKDFDLDLRED